MRRILVLVIALGLCYWAYTYFLSFTEVEDIFERLDKNYTAQVEEVCSELKLPSEYFKALIILESSAKLPAPTRYEHHIYERLKSVKEGETERYGSFTTVQMKLYDDETLKSLATSWGPLQIMGYHCIPLGLDFEQLQGESAVRYAIEWADKSYGKYLKRGDFADAFHIHNTGQPVPSSGKIKTHDPDYIQKGMNLIKKFRNEKNTSKL
jgi:hypothetical protein